LNLPRFPALKVLSLSQNRLSHLQTLSQYQLNLQLPNVTTLILDNNLFTSLAFLPDVLRAFPGLKALSLQGNQISSIAFLSTTGSGEEKSSFPQLESLNLSHNLIEGYAFIDALPRLFPRLTSLRVSNNPFFAAVTSTHPPTHDAILRSATGPSSTSSAPPARTLPGTSRSDAAFSLILARIPTLLTLNHSSITWRDREEGEIYYTSLAERELSAAISRITTGTRNQEPELNELKKRYPRYEELCMKYDRESVFDTQKASSRQATSKDNGACPTYAPGTLGARLVKTHFYIPSPANLTGAESVQTARSAVDRSITTPTTFSRLIPRTISVYTLKALLARTFNLPALQFRLVYESLELDPVVSQRGGYEKAKWESWGDWDLDRPPQEGAEKEGQKWKRREVEIVDGTREWGFYIEDGAVDVTIRVEPFKLGDRRQGAGGKS
jgi:tubulin-specific chaperone E